MRRLSGIEDIVHLYDGFILDLWGVLIDGQRVLPGAIDTLQELRRAKRKVWLLSNVPRRVHTIVKKITGIGIGEDLYDGILTSGEVVWSVLKEKFQGQSCLYIGPEENASLYENIDIKIVTAVGDADFLMISGSYHDPGEIKHIESIVKQCAAKNLPMICPNPDRMVHVGDQLKICAGTFADQYEAMGGRVEWFGKPFKSTYARLLKEMAVETPLAVGDSMVTDIAGATGAGIDSILVSSGIHREEEINDHFFTRYPYKPLFLMNNFNW